MLLLKQLQGSRVDWLIFAQKSISCYKTFFNGTMFEKPLNWLKSSLAWYNRTVSRDMSLDEDTKEAWLKFDLMLSQRTTIFAAIICIEELFLLAIGKTYCNDSEE